MAYIVESSKNKGNSIVASQVIKSGEFIVLDEKPFVWNCVSIRGHNFHKHCGECGIVLRSQLFSSLKVALQLNNVINVTEVLQMIEDFIPVKDNSCIPCDCRRNCDVKYCSSECRHIALEHGHDWLCESLQLSSDSNQQIVSIDEKGHFGLACKVYARIATQTLFNFSADPSTDIATEALRVAIALLAEFHYDDFTRTMHAYRTGRLEIDPSMFDSVIFPAYFSAHLATPLALTKDIFAQSGAVLWGDKNNSEPDSRSQERNSAFLSSEIFSEQFYSRIIGMFTVNCLSVFVPSPLDFILSEARREQAHSGPVSSGNSVLTSRHDPLVVGQVVAFLQRQLQEQQSDRRSDDEGQREAEGSFLGMSASGLFAIFSKTNHSCLCNTSIHGSDRVTVSIRATEDIPVGAEVTNCYIHHDSINSNSGGDGGRGVSSNNTQEASGLAQNEQHVLNRRMTKKQRYRALRQYMFECACPLCSAQEIDSDEDSD